MASRCDCGQGCQIGSNLEHLAVSQSIAFPIAYLVPYYTVVLRDNGRHRLSTHFYVSHTEQCSDSNHIAKSISPSMFKVSRMLIFFPSNKHSCSIDLCTNPLWGWGNFYSEELRHQEENNIKAVYVLIVGVLFDKMLAFSTNLTVMQTDAVFCAVHEYKKT